MLEPVRHVGAMQLSDLQNIDAPKGQDCSATPSSLCKGARANNVLLTGARGTGKSSLIQRLLARLCAAGPAPD